MELKNSKFDLYQYSPDIYRVVVFDQLLARRVNKVLKQYVDYSFQEGEEPIFKFNQSEMSSVLRALKVDS